MDNAHSPLDMVAETVSEQTAEAFGLLGNETRLAILLALWVVMDPDLPPPEPSESAISFSELREQVGLRDSGQFNYHLEKLTGPFVEQTDAGYTLTTRAEQVLSAMLAGTLADQSSFEGEPVDVECHRCGAPTVIDYNDGLLIVRCTSCNGAFHEPDDPPGILAKLYRPPVGLANRTPQEFYRYGNTWDRHRLHSMIEGVCPDCSGSVTTTIHVCDVHDTHDETVCEHCGTLYEIQSLFLCDVCKSALRTPAWSTIFTEVAVLAFFHEHEIDPFALYDEFSLGVIRGAIKRVTVQDEEPLELEVRVELDGDRLNVTLDDEAHVLDVTKEDEEVDRNPF
jgi:DNA-binding transcriptional ArsR family regulator